MPVAAQRGRRQVVGDNEQYVQRPFRRGRRAQRAGKKVSAVHRKTISRLPAKRLRQPARRVFGKKDDQAIPRFHYESRLTVQLAGVVNMQFVRLMDRLRKIPKTITNPAVWAASPAHESADDWSPPA